MKVIAGLGNPGSRYQNTRHNAGFMAVDLLADRHRIRITRKGFGGMYGTGTVCGIQVLLLKPLTFMNLSGRSVKSAFLSKAEELSDLLVVSDEADLQMGDLRLKRKGSSGGHNGLRSVIAQVGTDFPRLRIGITPVERQVEDMTGFVLSRFTRAERAAVDRIMEKAADCIEMWVKEGIEKAMNHCNSPDFTDL